MKFNSFVVYLLICCVWLKVGYSLKLEKRNVEIKKILIIGGTGQAGSKMVKEALEKGIQVKAFCRNPNKLPETLLDKVEAVSGDVLNYGDVHKAVKGVDAVIFTVGPQSLNDTSKYMTRGLQNVITAMKEENIEIINVILSVFTIMPIIEVPEMYRNEAKDTIAMYNALQNSDLKYIASCPPNFINSPFHAYEAQIGGMPGGKNFNGGINVISLNQLAKFTIDSLSKPEYYRHIVGVRNKIE